MGHVPAAAGVRRREVLVYTRVSGLNLQRLLEFGDCLVPLAEPEQLETVVVAGIHVWEGGGWSRGRLWRVGFAGLKRESVTQNDGGFGSGGSSKTMYLWG